ncbi:Nif3-like dinuclear metal center hexameric protein [Spiroplasma endosymbiont of Othius punctulatus]|uniref:Nif3-like dinuclear metal center hexameric protein n=1 Tax=Spiroplasma endosymbiont of Othius punctulatus TaxID=3066289 RepID=UPI0030CA91A4
MSSKTIDRNVLINKLEILFPVSLASEWDKPGIQIEQLTLTDNIVFTNFVVTCLDVTSDVIKFAVKNNANLIISRHPFIFNELEIELSNPAKKEIYKTLVEKNIQVYSIHTNYDASSDRFLIKSGLPSVFKNFEVSKSKFNDQTFEIKFKNALKKVDVINSLKAIFETEDVQFSTNTDLNEMIDKFYICTGSGGDVIIENNITNLMFVTGEIKWNQWVYMVENKINAFAFGHYMENTFVKHMVKLVKEEFSELDIIGFDIKNMYKSMKG